MHGTILLTSGLEGQSCSLVFDLAATWRWPTFAQRIQNELAYGFAP